MIKVRRYEQVDSIVLWDIFFNTVRTVNTQDYSLAQVQAWAPESFDMSVWERKMDEIKPFVAELDNIIVGYCDLQSDGLIDHFFCHHQYQGKGVGRRLMSHIVSLAIERNIARIYSHVSLTAKPFFERFGFRVVSEQNVKVRGEALINFEMEKWL
ncbi:GNAT family N-acetyltransferase [Marinomonas sp. CT5]|uniref:GNAT family N-acetyltransferase n=1 Tax=Marinomonas sp. CT5 TaxID=2066133 RepID=UPI001BAF039B|nr:GNAT family N-acetyltransferase [Marinomonas sp. CT5]QUX95770.1 GNAT family N-acetyltransferase [Marinomonas sp. CT5]